MTEQNTQRSLRDYWTFEYSAADVAKAARKREQHHSERLAYWNEQMSVTEAAIRERGLDFSTRVSPGKMSNTAYNQTVTIDNELLTHMRETQERIEHHTQCREKFAAYAAALLSQDATVLLPLTVDDIEFFHLDEPGSAA